MKYLEKKLNEMANESQIDPLYQKITDVNFNVLPFESVNIRSKLAPTFSKVYAPIGCFL